VAASAIRPLARHERREAAGLLVAAFILDPLYLALFGPDAAHGRRDRLALARFIVAANRCSGGTSRVIAGADGLVALCLVAPPGGGSWWRTAALALRFAPVWLRLGTVRVRLLRDTHARARALAPSAPHHYLSVLAVRPDSQGRGLARRLVEHLALGVDRHPSSTGIALDTENPVNADAYHHLGFEHLGSATAGGLTVAAFFRPRAG